MIQQSIYFGICMTLGKPKSGAFIKIHKKEISFKAHCKKERVLQIINRGYYMVARRYEFYFRVAKQSFTNECSEWVKHCFCHEKIKFISSSRRVMFFLLYRQKDIDKIIEGNDRNYVIDKLTCEIMENKPLGSRM